MHCLETEFSPTGPHKGIQRCSKDKENQHSTADLEVEGSCARTGVQPPGVVSHAWRTARKGIGTSALELQGAGYCQQQEELGSRFFSKVSEKRLVWLTPDRRLV